MKKKNSPRKGCLSKKAVEIYTRDKHGIYVGQKLYWWNPHHEQIVEFRVSAWHDGKTSDLYFSRQDSSGPAWVNMRGRGGAGVYPSVETSVYSFFPARETWADLEALLEARERYYTKLIRQTTPIKQSTRYGN